MDLTLLAVIGAAVFLASLVQATLGIGLSLVAAPVVALLDPSLIPGTMLVLGLVLPLLSLAHEWRHVSWATAGWMIGARVATTPVGLLTLRWLSPSAIGVLVGCIVLAAIALTVWRLDVQATRRNLVIAGAVAGVGGTAASIGGPPAAVVLQHERGPRLRATLAAFLSCGAITSLAALAIGGELTRHQLLYGVSWIPALALGFAAAVPLRKYIHGPGLRYAVLTLAGVSSVVAIIRGIF